MSPWRVRKENDGRWWIIMPGGRYGSCYGSFAELLRTWKYDYRLPIRGEPTSVRAAEVSSGHDRKEA